MLSIFDNKHFNLFMKNRQQSQQRDFEPIGNNLKDNKIASQFLQKYTSFLTPEVFDQSNIKKTLRQHNIAYNPHLQNEYFKIELQRIVLSSESVRVIVKLGFFSLTVSAYRVNSNNFFRNQDNIQGSYGTIYFTRFGYKQLCFKSLPFKNENEFVKIFRKVVKEWSILKICSVLECGPFMQNYFGFDLLIYDDCIQYATEKGYPPSEFGVVEAKQLKKQLALMHHLHIIHYDIKPDNIVFSKTYQKPVFIDFGLSQIIKEQIGFKTFAGFRGTPNYCCPQMVALMMEDGNYVDLYYNDCYSLDATINEMCSETANQNLATELIQLDKKRYSSFLLISFEYHYLSNNVLMLKKTLDLLKDNQQNIKYILNFIKQTSNEIFLSIFFMQHLKQFSQYAEYQQIMNQVKSSAQKIFFELPVSKDAFRKDSLLISISNYQLQTQEQKRGGNADDYHRFFSIILKLNSFEENSVWHYLNISFYCVRFDAKNLQVHQKIIIAKKVVELLRSFRQQNKEFEDNSPSSIRQIRFMFKAILQFCLETNTCKQSKQLIFSICQQMVLCDIDLSQYIDKLLAFFQLSFTSPLQHFLVVLECAMLSNLLFNIQSDSMDKVDQIYQKIETYRVRKWQRIKGDTYEDINKQISTIMTIMGVLAQSTTIQLFSFQRQLQKLKNIKNIKIKQHLLHLLTFKQIQIVFYESTNKKMLQMASFAKQFWKYRKIDFVGYLQITTTLLNLSFSQTDLEVYSSIISKIINCKQISDKIQFHTFFSDYNCNQEQLRTKINKLSRYYERLNTISQEGDFKLHEIIHHITCQDIAVTPQLSDQLVKFYKIYRQFDDKNSRVCENMVQCYYQIWWRSQIQFFFYKLSEETQKLFLENIAKAQEQFCLYVNNPSKQAEMVFYSFKKQVYRCKYFLHQKEYATCLRILGYLIMLCEALNIHFLCLQLHKLMNKISMVLLQDSQLSTSHIFQLYQFCKLNNDLSFYLFQVNSGLTFRTLCVFARSNHTHFKEFLLALVDLLSKNPIPSYFIALTQAIDSFLVTDSAFCNLLHYRNIGSNQNSNWINPYFLIFYVYSLNIEIQAEKHAILKTIASNIDSLCFVAKGWVLSRYFKIYLLLLRQKQRKMYFIFRQAKIYLSKGRHKRELAFYKTFYPKNRKKNKTSATQMLEKKVTLAISYLLTKRVYNKKL